MTAIQVFIDNTLSSGTECLNSILFTFFHFCLWSTSNNWYTITSMNLVPLHTMSTQISNTPHFVHLLINLYLKRFHGLLNRFTNLSKSSINTCSLDASICCFLDSLQEIVVSRIKCYSECTICHETLDM